MAQIFEAELKAKRPLSVFKKIDNKCKNWQEICIYTLYEYNICLKKMTIDAKID
jgi:hypothetical protein